MAPMCSRWPGTREELVEEQLRPAALEPAPWRLDTGARVGGVFVCFARGGSGPGRAGDPAWAAACAGRETVAVAGRAAAPYEAGLLALREGALLEAAARALGQPPNVLLVDATGRDHPRRAGLAPHLRVVLDLHHLGMVNSLQELRSFDQTASTPSYHGAPGRESRARPGTDIYGHWERAERKLQAAKMEDAFPV
jgi:hypothetical protein